MGRPSWLLIVFLALPAFPGRAGADGPPPGPASALPPIDATDAAAASQDDWPCLIAVPTGMRPRIREIWTTSATFQQQCARLAQAGVQVSVTVSALLRGSVRASSVIRKRNGHVFFVSIVLRDDWRLEEDLPHEIEHAIEQIDHRNLAVDAATRRGAWASGAHAYETERARLAGIRARTEVRNARKVGSPRLVLARSEPERPAR